MRVLMLTQFYPPIVGGEEQHVRNLSRALAARGHSVAVATLWHEGLAEFETDDGVRVYRVRGTMARLPFLFSAGGRRFAPPFPDPEVTLALRRIVRRERPDVIHAHNWLVHSFLPLKVSSGAPLVVTLHNYNLACATVTLMRDGAPCDGPGAEKCLSCVMRHYGAAKGVPTLLSHAAMRRAERRAVDMFLPVSRAVAEGNQLAADRLPYDVIPNFIPDDAGLVADTDSVPDDAYSEYGKYLARLPEGRFLLFVGALSRVKGVDVLLRAYAGLRDAPPLVLIGYPMPDTDELLADLPANVTALRDWPHGAVMLAWRRALAGVVPSVWPDPCPTVSLEAMASGVPVIAAATGGLPDQIGDGTNGLLVPPGDADALRDALERLRGDAALRERLARAATASVPAFQAGSVVPRIEGVYREAIERRRMRGIG